MGSVAFCLRSLLAHLQQISPTKLAARQSLGPGIADYFRIKEEVNTGEEKEPRAQIIQLQEILQTLRLWNIDHLAGTGVLTRMLKLSF